MNNQTPISLEEVRDWLKLPPDILTHIFLKLRAIDILLRVQPVCSTWRKASKEPLLFRSIHLYDMMIGLVSFEDKKYDMQKMVQEAVDRSCGQLVAFSLYEIFLLR
ncbi:hypothetical protein MKW98_032234 [Papaver atlanticum]|uniref:F-box domain-containing protein n=1 Tax=Papaver atlanticum TaxID=357466 RepID=A0AAD4SGR3_9MAGN|nr:hypothetical protein MKW98_032234 [Papaver atlanticum]